jgi:hypothetical protein
MFLIFDPKTLIVNIKAGALEKYEPTPEIIALVEKTEILKAKRDEKLKELQVQFDEFMKTEIDPVSKEIQKEVMDINKKTYPQLEELQKKSN